MATIEYLRLQNIERLKKSGISRLWKMRASKHGGLKKIGRFDCIKIAPGKAA